MVLELRVFGTWDFSAWFLVGNGGMGFGDDDRGTLREYHGDPFPHSLPRFTFCASGV